jgi:hypothetical protein
MQTSHLEPIIDSDTQLQYMVKLYDVDSDEFRINDILEFVGVCYPAEGGSGYVGQDDADDDMDIFTSFHIDAGATFGNLRILHAFTYRRLGSSFPLLLPMRNSGSNITDNNMLVLNPIGGCHLFADNTLMSKQMYSREDCSHLRQLLKDTLKCILKGDDLVAEYIMLSLFSKVYNHKLGGRPLGYVSFNISGFETSHEHYSWLTSLVSMLMAYHRSIRSPWDVSIPSWIPCRFLSNPRTSQ